MKERIFTKLIPFDQLLEGELVFQEYRHGSAIIPCRIIDEIDSKHVRMVTGTECPWTHVQKDIPDFRYWNDIPTDEQRTAALWN